MQSITIVMRLFDPLQNPVNLDYKQLTLYLEPVCTHLSSTTIVWRGKAREHQIYFSVRAFAQKFATHLGLNTVEVNGQFVVALDDRTSDTVFSELDIVFPGISWRQAI